MRMGLTTGAFIAMLAFGMGQAQAQASKPKAVQPVTSPSAASATQAVQAGIGSAATRTFTGRPADLDPRIPWLEDLGMPQSGGPEPLVKTGELRLPMVGGLQSLAAFGDGVAVVIRHRGAPPAVFHMEWNGAVRWSRTLTEGVAWELASSVSTLLCVPVGVSGRVSARPRVLGLDGAGNTAGRWDWPLDAKSGQLHRMALKEGVIIGEFLDGRRIHVRIDPKSTVDAEDVVTEGDVEVGGETTREDRARHWKEGYLVLGARVDDGRGASDEAKRNNQQRRRRAGKWRGHRLAARQLPFGNEPEKKGIGEWWKSGVRGGQLLALEEDGSVWLGFSLWNPYRMSFQEMNEAIEKDSPKKRLISRAGVALFAPDGRLRGYMLKSLGDSYIFPVTNAVYILRGENTLVRVEPMRAR